MAITFNGSAGGQNPQAIVTKTGGTIIAINEDIPANQTDLLFNIAFDKDRLKEVYLISTENLTIETNSSSAADDTISMLADQPLLYWDSGPANISNPFSSADVTAFYLTNTTACNISGYIIHDPTA